MALTEAKQAEIERACLRLAADYSFFADTGRFDEWAALFAEDGVMSAFGQDNVGRKAIRAVVGAQTDIVTMHVISNARIDVVSEDEARGSFYIALYAAPKVNGAGVAKQTEPAMLGMYEDVYRRTGQGWRFAKRAFRPLIAKPAPQ